MSKRKPATRVDKILPDDTHLSRRNSAWRALMEKYSKCEERGAIEVKEYLDAGERVEPSDDESDSDSGDSEEGFTDEEADSDVENREEIRNQLRRVVDERKPVWKETGLQQQMAELELPNLESNLLSRKKVEDWLFNRPFRAGAGIGTRRMSQHQQIIMSEQTEAGKQTKIEERMDYLTMTEEGGDDDSLQSVDTASYIRASRQQQSSVTNRVTIIKKFTKTVEFKALPPLEEHASLPMLTSTSGNASRSDSAPPESSVSGKASRVDVPLPVPSASRKACKSDSTLEKKDTKSKSSRGRRNASESPRKPEKSTKKQQKKSFKKKAVPASRKESDKPRKPNAVEQYEEALKNGAKAKKVPRTYRAAPKRNEWRVSDRSSSDEDSDEVFTKPKPEPKTPPRKKSPHRKVKFASPSTLNIIGSFDAINLVTPERKKSPPSQVMKAPEKPPQVMKAPEKPPQAMKAPEKPPQAMKAPEKSPPVIDQTTNLTALFSDANEKIVNSTEIGVASTSLLSGAGTSRSNSTKSSTRSERFPGYPEDRAVVVYRPAQITEHNRKVRIFGHQMDLSKVTRQRHLQKFQTFSCVIHSNSSIVFYPSDSEDELPGNSASDEDSDDPLSNYSKRDAPLRVVERAYRKGQEGR